MKNYQHINRLSIVKRLTNRFTNLSIAALFFATTFAGAAPLLLASTANAVASDIINENFSSCVTGSSYPTPDITDWTFKGTSCYRSYGVGSSTALRFAAGGESATVDLGSSSPSTLSFYLAQEKAGNKSDSSLIVTQYAEGGSSLSSATYTTSQNSLALNSDTRKIEFKMIQNDGNNLAFDNVIVTGESAVSIDKQISVDGGSTWLEIGNGDLADVPTVAKGSFVEERVVVKNTGGVTLHNISVSESGQPGYSEFQFGGMSTISELAPTASLYSDVLGSAQQLAADATTTDTATVTGYAPDNTMVTASDQAKYIVSSPAPAPSIDSGYFAIDKTGFNVGFHTHNFKSVNGVTVTLKNAKGDIVANTGKTDLYNLIDGQADKEISTPFSIPNTATDDTFWDYGNVNWTSADDPTEAVITITGQDGTSKSITVNGYSNNIWAGSPSPVKFTDLLPPVTAPNSPADLTAIHTTDKKPFIATNDKTGARLTWSPVAGADTYAYSYQAPGTKNMGTVNILTSAAMNSPYKDLTGLYSGNIFGYNGQGSYIYNIYAVKYTNSTRTKYLLSNPSTITLLYDTEGPHVTYSAPSAGSFITTKNDLTVTGTVADPGNLSSVDHINFYVSAGDKYDYDSHNDNNSKSWKAYLHRFSINHTKNSNGIINQDGTFTVTIPKSELKILVDHGVTSGDDITVTAVPFDSLGNGSGTRNNLTLKVDDAAPTGHFTYINNMGTWYNGVMYNHSAANIRYKSTDLSDNGGSGLWRSNTVINRLASDGSWVHGAYCGDWILGDSIMLQPVLGSTTPFGADGTRITDCTWANGNSWQNGAYSIEHRAYDLVGNYVTLNSNQSNELQKFVIYNNARLMETVSAPAYINGQNSFQVSGKFTPSSDQTAAEFDHVQIYFFVNGNEIIGHYGTRISSIDSNGNWTLDIPESKIPANLQSGDTIEIKAVGFDRAWNQNVATAKIDFDNVPPTLRITSPNYGSYAGSRWYGLDISGDETDVVGDVTVAITDTNGNVVDTQTTTPVNGTWKITTPNAKHTFTSGQKYTITVTGVDRAGNQGTTSASFTADNEPPVVTYTDTTPSPLNNYVIPVTIHAASTFSPLTKAYVEVRDPNNAWITACWFNNLSGNSADETCNLQLPSNSPDGQYKVTAYAYNQSGIQSDYAVRTFTLDNTAPVVSLDASPASPVSLERDGKLTITGLITELHPGHYWLMVTGPDGEISSSSLSGDLKLGEHTYTNQTGTDTYSFTNYLNLTGLKSGQYKIDLEARDGAGGGTRTGNKDAASSKVIYVSVDNTAPDAPTANFTANNDGTQSVTLADSDPSATIYYTTDGATPTQNSTAYSGSFALNPTVAPDVTTIKAIAYDPAGNASGVYSVSGPSISGEASQKATTSSITLTWTTNEPATSRVIYDTVTHATLGTGANYGYANSTTEDSTLTTTHSVTINGLTPGTTYYFRIVSHGSPTEVSNEITGFTKVASTNGTPTFKVNFAPAADTGHRNSNTNGANGASNNGQVLGTSTSTNKNNDSGQGHVKGDQTTKKLATNASDKNVGTGFSWWWLLPIVIVLAAMIWFLLAARKSGDDKA